MGLALLTGWEPDVIRRLTVAEVDVIADHQREQRRAAARARARGFGG